MRHLDPDDLPDRDPTAPQDPPPCPHNEMIRNNDPAQVWKCAVCGYVYGDGPEPAECRPPEPEDCPACLGNHACDVHTGGPIMPNDRMRIDAAGNVTDAHGRGNL